MCNWFENPFQHKAMEAPLTNSLKVPAGVTALPGEILDDKRSMKPGEPQKGTEADESEPDQERYLLPREESKTASRDCRQHRMKTRP